MYVDDIKLYKCIESFCDREALQNVISAVDSLSSECVLPIANEKAKVFLSEVH
ncbi:unnamed protein product [Nippostrongylus brasiliensis]|uniref:Reverse transcriptase domain-containing protein n=1 Tax=Nippostrongylus brasiliensis TaxID=27835 RepID=A0A0N4YGE6_NIPBR|nr:unnamed protein product [Nippostrongylus brasiliensis]